MRVSLILALGFSSACLGGCSQAPSSQPRGGGSTGGGSGSGASSGLGSGGSSVIMVPTHGGNAGSSGTVDDVDQWPSSACKGAPIVSDTGEYCQGPAYDPTTQGGTIQNATGCGTTLWGIARDFVGYNQTATNPVGAPHPDFGSHYCCGNPWNTVLATLGSDGTPDYNPANVAGDYTMSGVGLAGPDAFKQWYHNSAGVNLAYLVGFHLAPASDGVTRVFSSKRYFPVDAVGFGNFNDYGEDGKSHNFGFTTELHTKFKYKGGEVFSFEGDDDLWVFINKQLAIDLGGIHVAMQGSVKLDEFASKANLVIGEIYNLDLFQAERHPAGSDFKITSSMTFVDCGVDPIIR